MERTFDRLSLFNELTTCIYNFYLWQYDIEMNLLSCNCTNAYSLGMIFALQNVKEYIQNYILTDRLPIIFSNDLGLTWITVFEPIDGQVKYIHVLGPVFTDEVSMKEKELALSKHALSVESRKAFLSLLELIPVVTITQLIQYGIMLQCCITKEKIRNSDFHIYTAKNTQQEHTIDKKTAVHSNRQISYLYEQKLMEVVENGNIDYLKSHNQTFFSGNIGKISLSDPLRQAKNLCIIYATLCTRASIRGGLPPEIAYTLSDNYIQNCESCEKSTEVFQIMKSMFADFVERVHNYKIANGISPLIKKCFDYIQLHVEEELSPKTLADYTGYTQNYLGTKFKAETGISLREYINQIKVEYAKTVLLSTSQSIFEISEHLGFCSSSYFTKIFHEQTGITPAEYRITHTNTVKS